MEKIKYLGEGWWRKNEVRFVLSEAKSWEKKETSLAQGKRKNQKVKRGKGTRGKSGRGGTTFVKRRTCSSLERIMEKEGDQEINRYSRKK